VIDSMPRCGPQNPLRICLHSMAATTDSDSVPTLMQALSGPARPPPRIEKRADRFLVIDHIEKQATEKLST